MSKKSSVASPIAPDRDWQGEDDHRALMRAEEIRSDPSRMKHVKRHHRKQKKALAQVQQSMLQTRR